MQVTVPTPQAMGKLLAVILITECLRFNTAFELESVRIYEWQFTTSQFEALS
jgi:hypothetical protein